MNDVPAGGASHLFVYGTLRDAARLAEVLGSMDEWRYCGPASVTADLYDVGEYPAVLLREEDAPRVEGLLVELFDPVTAFAALDAYEGVEEGLYVRRQCRARLADGSQRIVWIYEYNLSVRGLPRLNDPSGRGDSRGDPYTRQLERRR